MKSHYLYLLIILLIHSGCQDKTKKYEPTWESLEQVNPVPEWFKDAKFGIYFHWGVYSVPAYANEWYPRHMHVEGTREFKHHKEKYGHPFDEWPFHYFITGNYDKSGNFVQFAPKLKYEGGQFDPEEWADLFVKSGARFAGPVAEHHDGFSMWESSVNQWNTVNYGPEMDLVKLFSDAIRERGMKLILSMHHAYNITGYFEHVPNQNDQELKLLYGQLGTEENERIWLEKHKEIIDLFRPDIIWQDFNLTAISEETLLNFLAYYYNSAAQNKMEVVTTYKDALNTDVAVLDYERGGPLDLTDYYWLTDDAISQSSWCYTEGISYYSSTEVLHSFIDRVSKNGNLLLNISPRADGSIPNEQRDILLAMGDWLGKYGEAIYETRAWQIYGEGPTQMGSGHHHAEGVSFRTPTAGTSQDIRFTRTKDNTALYAIVLGWSDSDKELIIKNLNTDRFNTEHLTTISILTPEKSKVTLNYTQDNNGLHIYLPEQWFYEPAYVIKLDFDGEIPHFNRSLEF